MELIEILKFTGVGIVILVGIMLFSFLLIFIQEKIKLMDIKVRNILYLIIGVVLFLTISFLLGLVFCMT